MAAAADGALPKILHIACHLGMSVQDAELLLSELVEVDLIDMSVIAGVRSFKMHDWKEHQYLTDVSTDRVRKFRSKHKHETDETFQKPFHAVSETAPESESESYTDTKIKPYGLSFLTAARDENEDDDRKVLNVSLKRTKDGKKERLHTRAGGLGLDVQDLVETCNRHKAKNKPAYFTALCIQRLSAKLPGVDEKIIRAALWDADSAAWLSLQLLLVAA